MVSYTEWRLNKLRETMPDATEKDLRKAAYWKYFLHRAEKILKVWEKDMEGKE